MSDKGSHFDLDIETSPFDQAKSPVQEPGCDKAIKKEKDTHTE